MKPLAPDILLELQQLAPALAAVERKNPFRTPPEFFDTLPESIAEKCRDIDEFREIAPTLFKIKNDAISAMSVPKGFFDDLQATVMQQIKPEAQAETETDAEIPKLHSLHTYKNPFSVPSGFFEQMHRHIMAKLPEQELVDTDSENAYENDPLTPTLDRAAQYNPFVTPQGFFDDLQRDIMQEIRKMQDVRQIDPVGAKVVNMPSRAAAQNQPEQRSEGKWKRIVSYATSAAAMLTVLFVGYQFFVQKPNSESQIAYASIGPAPQIPMKDIMAFMENLPASDAGQYIQDNLTEFEQYGLLNETMNNLNEKDLDPASLAADLNTKDLKAFLRDNLNESDINEVMQEVSNIDIDQIDLKDFNLSADDLKNLHTNPSK